MQFGAVFMLTMSLAYSMMSLPSQYAYPNISRSLSTKRVASATISGVYISLIDAIERPTKVSSSMMDSNVML